MCAPSILCNRVPDAKKARFRDFRPNAWVSFNKNCAVKCDGPRLRRVILRVRCVTALCHTSRPRSSGDFTAIPALGPSHPRARWEAVDRARRRSCRASRATAWAKPPSVCAVHAAEAAGGRCRDGLVDRTGRRRQRPEKGGEGRLRRSRWRRRGKATAVLKPKTL
jgi:hypothetical protein